EFLYRADREPFVDRADPADAGEGWLYRRHIARGSSADLASGGREEPGHRPAVSVRQFLLGDRDRRADQSRERSLDQIPLRTHQERGISNAPSLGGRRSRAMGRPCCPALCGGGLSAAAGHAARVDRRRAAAGLRRVMSADAPFTGEEIAELRKL